MAVVPNLISVLIVKNHILQKESYQINKDRNQNKISVNIKDKCLHCNIFLIVLFIMDE